MKFGGVPHPPMIGFKQSVKVFSAKFSLPTDPRKFSPSKVYCYTVCTQESNTYTREILHDVLVGISPSLGQFAGPLSPCDGGVGYGGVHTS